MFEIYSECFHFTVIHLGNSKTKNQDPWKFYMILFGNPGNPTSFF